jgi:hypothetical protein
MRTGSACLGYLWQLSKVASTEIKCFFFNFFPSTGACLLAPADAVSALGESFGIRGIGRKLQNRAKTHLFAVISIVV